METWKDIPNYEGIYEVSDKGRVRTAKGKTTHSNLHGKRVWKQRVLKQKTDKDGYKRVTLWKNKSPEYFLVHRLVASVFIEKEAGKNIINHIDCNPSNNYVENLEWCDYSHNLKHAYVNGLNKSPDQIVLLNTNTNKFYLFISKSEASRFLGRNEKYISAAVLNGKREIDEYEIFVRPGKRRGVKQ